MAANGKVVVGDHPSFGENDENKIYNTEKRSVCVCKYNIIYIYTYISISIYIYLYIYICISYPDHYFPNQTCKNLESQHPATVGQTRRKTMTRSPRACAAAPLKKLRQPGLTAAWNGMEPKKTITANKNSHVWLHDFHSGSDPWKKEKS